MHQLALRDKESQALTLVTDQEVLNILKTVDLNRVYMLNKQTSEVNLW